MTNEERRRAQANGTITPAGSMNSIGPQSSSSMTPAVTAPQIPGVSSVSAQPVSATRVGSPQQVQAQTVSHNDADYTRFMNDSANQVQARNVYAPSLGLARMVDASGHMVDSSGMMVDTSGRMVDSSGMMVDTSGRMVDPNAAGSVNYGEREAQTAGVSAIGQELQNQALDQLRLGGRLSDEEHREATQSARQAYSDRGMGLNNEAMFAEALNRDRYATQRMQERQAFAQGVDQQDLARQQFNMGQQNAMAQAAAQGHMQAGMANQGTQMQGMLANQQAGMTGDLANQQVGFNAALANQQAGMTGDLANQQVGFNAALANQQVGFNAALANQGTQQAYDFTGAGMAMQAQMANQQAGLQAGMANQGMRQDVFLSGQSNQMQADLANQAASNQASMYNSQAAMQADLANQAALNQASMYNSQAGLQAGMYNTSNNIQTQQFNAQAGLDAQMANQQATMNRYGMDTGYQQQNQMWHMNSAENARINAANEQALYASYPMMAHQTPYAAPAPPPPMVGPVHPENRPAGPVSMI